MAEKEEGSMEERDSSRGGDMSGSPCVRPVFMGNLIAGYSNDEVIALFERPNMPPSSSEKNFRPMPVDRIDVKRGYCFVFLKDFTSEADKELAERFVSDINGM
jgi:arginine/serine-rich splicing factor 4/5/6